jgi:hypothetical protein
MSWKTRLPEKLRTFLGWAAAQLPPPDRAWINALVAEMDVIEGSLAKLAWGTGGLRLLWTFRRRDMTGAPRFWLWVCCLGALLGFMLLTSALPDEVVVPITLFYCGIAGLLTGVWTDRIYPPAVVGGTTGLIGAGVLVVSAAVMHGFSVQTSLPLIVMAAVTLPTFAALGFLAGGVGGAIVSPVDAARSFGHAAAQGPAWRGLQGLTRTIHARRR